MSALLSLLPSFVVYALSAHLSASALHCLALAFAAAAAAAVDPVPLLLLLLPCPTRATHSPASLCLPSPLLSPVMSFFSNCSSRRKEDRARGERGREREKESEVRVEKRERILSALFSRSACAERSALASLTNSLPLKSQSLNTHADRAKQSNDREDDDDGSNSSRLQSRTQSVSLAQAQEKTTTTTTRRVREEAVRVSRVHRSALFSHTQRRRQERARRARERKRENLLSSHDSLDVTSHVTLCLPSLSILAYYAPTSVLVERSTGEVARLKRQPKSALKGRSKRERERRK